MYSTYSTAYSHKQLSDCFGVVHHNGFNGSVQHFDFLWPLLLLVFKDILLKTKAREERINEELKRGGKNVGIESEREKDEEKKRG